MVSKRRIITAVLVISAVLFFVSAPGYIELFTANISPILLLSPVFFLFLIPFVWKPHNWGFLLQVFSITIAASFFLIGNMNQVGRDELAISSADKYNCEIASDLIKLNEYSSLPLSRFQTQAYHQHLVYWPTKFGFKDTASQWDLVAKMENANELQSYIKINDNPNLISSDEIFTQYVAAWLVEHKKQLKEIANSIAEILQCDSDISS